MEARGEELAGKLAAAEKLLLEKEQDGQSHVANLNRRILDLEEQLSGTQNNANGKLHVNIWKPGQRVGAWHCCDKRGESRMDMTAVPLKRLLPISKLLS